MTYEQENSTPEGVAKNLLLVEGDEFEHAQKIVTVLIELETDETKSAGLRGAAARNLDKIGAEIRRLLDVAGLKIKDLADSDQPETLVYAFMVAVATLIPAERRLGNDATDEDMERIAEVAGFEDPKRAVAAARLLA